MKLTINNSFKNENQHIKKKDLYHEKSLAFSVSTDLVGLFLKNDI